MLLKDMMEMRKGCIFVLLCDESKRFWVSHTTNLMGAINRVCSDLETPKFILMKEDIEKIQIKVLEDDVEHEHLRRIRVALYVSHFESLGYTPYAPSNLVKYKVNTDIIRNKKVSQFIVYLTSGKGKDVIVGVFKKKQDMEEFVNTYYPDNVVRGIFYSSNGITEQYLKTYKYSMYDISKIKELSTT